MTRSDTPAGAFEHSPECARRLPYSDPLHRSLDHEHCGRCAWLWSLLDEAKNRRLAAQEAIKAFIVSELDGLPHGARGMSRAALAESLVAARMCGGIPYSVSYASGPLMELCLRQLTEDKILDASPQRGVRHYYVRGR